MPRPRIKKITQLCCAAGVSAAQPRVWGQMYCLLRYCLADVRLWTLRSLWSRSNWLKPTLLSPMQRWMKIGEMSLELIGGPTYIGCLTSSGLSYQIIYMMILIKPNASVTTSSSVSGRCYIQRVIHWTINHAVWSIASPLVISSSLLRSMISLYSTILIVLLSISFRWYGT